MHLKLNRKNQLPVHTQLKAQLIYLIQSGQLPAGSQLPTVRQLAGFLRVNRNTVAKVFADMQREGLLSCEPGRGSFVSLTQMKSKTKVERVNKLLSVVDDALEKAEKLGFSAEELFLTLYARIQTSTARTPSVREIRLDSDRHPEILLRRSLPVKAERHAKTALTRLSEGRPYFGSMG